MRSSGASSAPVPGRQRSSERIGLAIAVAIVGVYATAKLDATSLWLDEAYTLGAVNRLGASLRGTHGTMGFYYLLMSGWGLVSTATWWLRLPSVLFAIATLLVARPVARRVGGSPLVALGLPLIALGPLFEAKATEARGYSLETLIVTACWLCLLRGLDDTGLDSSRRWFIALVPLSVLGVFSHGLFVVHLVPLGVVALNSSRPWLATRRLAPAAVASGAAALALHASGAGDVGTNVPGGIGVLVASTFDDLLTTSALPRLLLAQLVVVGAALAIRDARRTVDRGDRPATLVAAAWTFLPCITLAALRAYDPVYNPRYLAPIGPGLGLLIAATVLRGDRLLTARRGMAARPRTPIPLLSLAVVVLMAACLATTRPYVDDDWRAAARLVGSQARPGDEMVFANSSSKEARQHRPPFEAAWREVEHRATPSVITSSRPLGEVRRFDDLRAPETLRQEATASRIWLIDHPTGGPDQTRAFLRRTGLLDGYRARVVWTSSSGVSVTLLDRR